MPKCGMPETIDSPSQALAVVTVRDPSQESHIDLLHRAAIGPVNADYYLPILARFETYDRGSPSWNWAASLCTLNWMAFRGLWRPALAYVGAVLAAVLALMALTHFTVGMAESIQWGLWAALVTLALLVPGVFGNTWLFKHQRRRLNAALAATPTLRDACLHLSRQASSRQRLMALLAANAILAAIVVTVWFWPSRAWRDAARMDEGRMVAADAAPQGASADSAPNPSAAQPSTAASQPEPAALAASAPTVPRMPTGEQAADAATRHAAIAARSRNAHLPSPPAAAIAAAAATPAARQVATPVAPAGDQQPAAAATEAAASGRFQINVGLFAEQANAQRAFTRLREAGLPATTQELTRNGRTLTRVRVGPFASRDVADTTAQKVRALQLDAVVIRQ